MRRDTALSATRLLCLAGVLALATTAPIGLAAAEDSDVPTHGLDDVPSARTRSLDSADTGRTESLDREDEGRTESADTVDTGRTEGLDREDTGRTESSDAVDTGHTEDLDAVEQRESEHVSATIASPAPPPAFPPIEDGNWEAQLARAREIVASAEARQRAADAAYSNMIARQYPTGSARVAIVEEKQLSERYVTQARAYQDRVAEAATRAGHPPR